MAELCAQHPKRFPAFVAAVSLDDVDAALQEAERAITTLGARGIQIFTNIAGHPLDEPRFAPVFAAMAAHDLPIWLHPARTAAMRDYAAEEKSRFEMWWCFGWPYETSVAMARLVFSGVFDRHPGLKIVTHHLGGGMIPFFDGRIGAGMEVLGSRTSDEDHTKVLPVAEAAASRLLPRILRRHRAVRRRQRPLLRPRLLRRGSRGVRDRRAARADRQDHRGGRCARSRSRDAPQDHAGKCRAAVRIPATRAVPHLPLAQRHGGRAARLRAARQVSAATPPPRPGQRTICVSTISADTTMNSAIAPISSE